MISSNRRFVITFWAVSVVSFVLVMIAGAQSASATKLFEAAQAAAAKFNRVSAIRARGHVSCGVDPDAPGFSVVDKQGEWRGLDIEFCAALASAIVGDRKAVKYFAINAGDQYRVLDRGEIDVLMRASSGTLSRDTEFGARFVDVLYYDGGSFLAPKNHSISSVLELSGASVCVLGGSAGKDAVVDFFETKNMRFQLVIAERWDKLVEIYSDGGCTVLYGDQSALADVRQKMRTPDEHMILPEQITKEPLGPVVKSGDDDWFSVVRWVLMALISAEELGLTSETVGDIGPQSPLNVRRFAGLEINHGAPLGLAKDWAIQMVRQVGNFSEVFERSLGSNSPLQLKRGMNALWRDGGLFYALPLR